MKERQKITDSRGKIVDQERIRADLGDLPILPADAMEHWPFDGIRGDQVGRSDFGPVPLDEAVGLMLDKVKSETYVDYTLLEDDEERACSLSTHGIGYEMEVVAIRCADDAWILQQSEANTD